MSWSQYWEWKTAIADADRFAAWSRDVAYLHRYMNTSGVRLPREVPLYGEIVESEFKTGCTLLSHTFIRNLRGDYQGGWRAATVYITDPIPFPPLVIRGPYPNQGEPIFTPTEVAFNGDYETGDDCEDFYITLDHLKAPHHDGIRTNMHPYDILVRSALVRLCHYFPTVHLSSDYGRNGFMIPVEICRYVFEDNNATPLWSHDFIDEDE